ncbi:hypothetical protein GCM10009546_36600 [Actinomadura livida]|uniref:Uncharacterized protein n=1 Tax=Actinomadura livida TaxID=79909 RepID=A0A7W7IFQ1_9ACTN|nr:MULTISPECIES: hypothetical protein [Actinomadura]MBB4775863.1 hypothetical protein [Actinomadura catellatispora]GGU40169.1 hypothetical protein GCM10010208_75240 [Actinomadura livida]
MSKTVCGASALRSTRTSRDAAAGIVRIVDGHDGDGKRVRCCVGKYRVKPLPFTVGDVDLGDRLGNGLVAVLPDSDDQGTAAVVGHRDDVFAELRLLFGVLGVDELLVIQVGRLGCFLSPHEPLHVGEGHLIESFREERLKAR